MPCPGLFLDSYNYAIDGPVLKFAVVYHLKITEPPPNIDRERQLFNARGRGNLATFKPHDAALATADAPGRWLPRVHDGRNRIERYAFGSRAK